MKSTAVTLVDNLGLRFESWIVRPFKTLLVRLQYIASWPIFSDTTTAYTAVLRYADLDRTMRRALYIQAGLVLGLIALNSYGRLPLIAASPLGWRWISPMESGIVLVVAGLAIVGPWFVRAKTHNHLWWRASLAISMACFSYLFIFLSGGSLLVHWHMVLAMSLLVLYADNRLIWLLAGLFIVVNLFTTTIWSDRFYEYGYQWLSWPLQTVLLLVIAYVLTSIATTYRQAVADVLVSKEGNDKFLAIAAHELRTPLTSMKGYVEVLERRLKRSGSVGLVEYTDKLDDQLSKMAGLVRDLLDISKIQSGQLAIRRERISINTVVAQSVEEVQGLLHHHHVVVHGWCNTPVLGDPVRLEQVLVNLLSNAIKYSPTADRVVIRVVESKAQVVISVQDFGMGIAKNEQATIFEPYFRSQHMERTDVPGGLGMGLYIAKEIIVWHGGRIWLDSELNKGTTFSLSLPLYKDGV